MGCGATNTETKTDNPSSNGTGTTPKLRDPSEVRVASSNWLDILADDLKQPGATQAIVVEFMAQLLFNFASCSAVVNAKALAGDTAILVPWQAATFHFLLLYVLIGGTMPISGGHFNPMVSVMVAYMGGLPVPRAAMYVVAQLAGAIIGSGLQYNALPPSLQDAAHAGIQAVPADHTVGQAFMGEVAASFILMFVVCLYGFDPKGDPKKIPLVMAITIALLIYIVGPISSMCINPARALGPAVASGFWQHHWIWWTAPFIGGFLAVVPYKRMLENDKADGA